MKIVRPITDEEMEAVRSGTPAGGDKKAKGKKEGSGPPPLTLGPVTPDGVQVLTAGDTTLTTQFEIPLCDSLTHYHHGYLQMVEVVVPEPVHEANGEQSTQSIKCSATADTAR